MRLNKRKILLNLLLTQNIIVPERKQTLEAQDSGERCKSEKIHCSTRPVQNEIVAIYKTDWYVFWCILFPARQNEYDPHISVIKPWIYRVSTCHFSMQRSNGNLFINVPAQKKLFLNEALTLPQLSVDAMNRKIWWTHSTRYRKVSLIFKYVNTNVQGLELSTAITPVRFSVRKCFSWTRSTFLCKPVFPEKNV